MRRGILTLTREELLELLKYYDINQKPDSQLSIKLKSANDNIKDINQIFVSSEELEDILDEIGPVNDDRPLLKETMSKYLKLLHNLIPPTIKTNCGTWIRTMILGFKGRRPTIRQSRISCAIILHK